LPGGLRLLHSTPRPLNQQQQKQKQTVVSGPARVDLANGEAASMPPSKQLQQAQAATAGSDHKLPDDMASADLAAAPAVAPGTPVSSAPEVDPFLSQTKNSFEIKDAELIFRQAWNGLVAKYGEENLTFPKEIMWLAGAPGAGKGAMTPIIKEYRGITAPPIEVGDLLTSPAAQALKAQGKLVGDQQVIELLLESLLKPEYATGCVVDGFPRTKEQAECIKLLFDHMQLLRAKYASVPELAGKFRRPIFHITVLYIDKEESVKRQMRRGELALHHNEMVANTGIGERKAVRETDLSAELAAERYRVFKEQVYESLKLVKSSFHFHFINAEGSPAEVQQRIISELSYQSSMELADETFEKVRRIPLASEVILAARHDLVRRLDHYRSACAPLFEQVIQVISQEFMHIIRRQALSGRAIIRSQNAIFSQHGAIDMALDLLSERGYTTTLDYTKHLIPARVNLQTGEIINTTSKVFEFTIEFPKPTIRRG
jgi:adenylate kinase